MQCPFCKQDFNVSDGEIIERKNMVDVIISCPHCEADFYKELEMDDFDIEAPKGTLAHEITKFEVYE